MSVPSRFDQMTGGTDNAHAVHPWRDLVEHHFYLGDLVSTEGGDRLLLMDALLFVPLVMAAFFYPKQALIWAVVLLAVSFGGYEGYVLWRRRHLHP